MRFDDEELGRLYHNYRDKNYSKLRNRYEPGYNSINKIQNLPINYIKKVENFLTPFLKFPIKVLDFGGDDGHNTPFNNSQNIIHVYDISNKAVKRGVKNVNKKNMLKKYDLIILSQVIEHVSYPKVIIEEVKSILDKNSIFYIELPLEKLLQNIWGGGAEKRIFKMSEKKETLA
jgi:2-polyprenyl-3-methyl-5-hydroxy-6-metoxy-1,4-benzoquinol methylase